MKKNVSGIIYVILSAVLFSLSGVLIKAIPWSSLTINGARSALAAIVMAIYMKRTGHRFVLNRAVLGGALCTLIMNITFVLATKMTSAANAIVLQFTSPIFIILFLWIFLKQKPRRPDLIACFFVFLGVICFFLDEISPEGTVGNLLAIVSGASYACVYMMKSWEGADFESAVLLSELAAVVMGVPSMLGETSFTAANVGCILILGIFQFGIAFVFHAKGLETVHPVTAVLASAIEPILNPIWVAIFLKETIGPISLVGAAIVMAALIVYNVWDAGHGAVPAQTKG